MAIAIIYALIGAVTGAAACYVASDQRLFHFVAGFLLWPLIALALVAAFIDDRRAPPQNLPAPRTGWPRTRRAQ